MEQQAIAPKKKRGRPSKGYSKILTGHFTPMQYKYIRIMSKAQNIGKSDYLRRLVEADMADMSE